MSLYHIPQNLISISRRFCFCIWWTSTGIILWASQLWLSDHRRHLLQQLQQEFKNSENNPLLSIGKALCSFKTRVYDESETNWTALIGRFSSTSSATSFILLILSTFRHSTLGLLFYLILSTITIFSCRWTTTCGIENSRIEKN